MKVRQDTSKQQMRVANMNLYLSTAKNMINRLLTFDPKERVTAEEALKDVWITSEDDNGINLAPNVRKGFNSRRTLKSLVTAVAAINKWKQAEHPTLEEEEEENKKVEEEEA